MQRDQSLNPFAYLAWFAIHLIRPAALFLSPQNGERIEVRGFDLSNRTTPHPACGHLLPIGCGEGIYVLTPHPGPLLVGRGEGEEAVFVWFPPRQTGAIF